MAKTNLRGGTEPLPAFMTSTDPPIPLHKPAYHVAIRREKGVKDLTAFAHAVPTRPVHAAGVPANGQPKRHNPSPSPRSLHARHIHPILVGRPAGQSESGSETKDQTTASLIKPPEADLRAP